MEKMLEEKREVPKPGKWIALTVLISVLTYVITDGWFTNKIEPQTVVAVYEPGRVRALVNKTDKSARMWKWPRILGTSIGVREEPIKDETKTVTTRFAMYTTDELTGKAEDKEYVQAYVVDIEIKVKDWEKFFQEINLDEINKERRKAGPFVRLAKDRFEVVAYLIESIIRGGETTDRFGELLRTEEGYPAMNLAMKISYARSQLLNRRNFLITLLDRYHFKTAEEIKKCLKEEIPWYWFAGPDMYEFLAQQYKDIQELTLSPYNEDISPEASGQRYIFGEDRLEIYRKAYQVYQYESRLMEIERNLEESENRQKVYSNKEEVQRVAQGFKKFLRSQGEDLRFLASIGHLQSLYTLFMTRLESNVSFAFWQPQVEFMKKGISEARKKFNEDPLGEVDRKRAEDIQKGVWDLATKEMSKKSPYFSSQEISQVFDDYLAKNNLQALSLRLIEYALLLVNTQNVETLSSKVKEALEFLDSIEIAREFHLDLKAKLDGQKINLTQILPTVKEHITHQQYLFQDSPELISLLWQEEKLKREKIQWENMKGELIPFFKYYSESNTELARNLRRVTAEENEALWEAAIEEALGGEDITELRLFLIHKVKEGDTLAKLAEKYEVNWQLVFSIYAREAVRRSLASDEDKAKFDRLSVQGIETGDWRPAYEFAKDIPLKVDESIIIKKAEEFTPQWFEKQEEYRKKREEVVKKYIYRWIEEFAPKVIQEYVPVSPWIDYIEKIYGIKIVDIKLRIEKDSMFTKDGGVKDEYHDLYYSKYLSKAEGES